MLKKYNVSIRFKGTINGLEVGAENKRDARRMIRDLDLEAYLSTNAVVDHNVVAANLKGKNKNLHFSFYNVVDNVVEFFIRVWKKIKGFVNKVKRVFSKDDKIVIPAELSKEKPVVYAEPYDVSKLEEGSCKLVEEVKAEDLK